MESDEDDEETQASFCRFLDDNFKLPISAYAPDCVPKVEIKERLDNIRDIQVAQLIQPSTSLAKGQGRVSLDIEMETGTGKTYVYIKTMFELNRRYGWCKFIVVVPSIAIREGVAKSFSMLEDHFMEHYGKKARWFVYNSSNLQQLDQF